MKNYLYAVLVLFLLPMSARSQSIDNFGLDVGNVFIYNYKYVETGPHSDPPVDSIFIAKITKDSIINSKKYFFFYGLYNKWVRLDSITGSLYAFDAANSCSTKYHYEVMIDSLAAKLNETVRRCLSISTVCLDTNDITLFNTQAKGKKFYYSYGHGNNGYMYERDYSGKFGLYSTRSESYIGSGRTLETVSLKGCIINNVIYGDTSVTSVEQISSSIPETIFLYQNYPNPFNPVTNIKFDIPKSSFVTLKIYDLLGREIAVLVSENLKAGSYQYDWNGSIFSSGVYFYKLETEGFIEVRKMLILK